MKATVKRLHQINAKIDSLEEAKDKMLADYAAKHAPFKDGTIFSLRDENNRRNYFRVIDSSAYVLRTEINVVSRCYPCNTRGERRGYPRSFTPDFLKGVEVYKPDDSKRG